MTKILSISDLFPSRYLKPSDVGENDLMLTIERLTIEEFGRGDRKENKPVAYFRETDKGLVLNKTNATTIARLYGDKCANWVGKKVALYVTEVSYQGTPMLGIRVRMRPPSQPQQPDLEIPEPPEPPDPWA